MLRPLPTALVALLLLSTLAGCTTEPDSPVTPLPGVGGENGSANATLDWTAFDADAAWAHVLWQVYEADGTTPRYRIPGTPGNTEVAEGLVANLTYLGWDAGLQRFNDEYRCDQVPMHNVVATLPGRSNETILLGAHYDSRPHADRDPDPAKHDDPVLGANDGASGVAVLVEAARLLAGQENNLTYRVVFFDGEDGGAYHGTANEKCSPWIVGSRHYVSEMTDDEVERTRVMILLDMVGDKDLYLRRESASSAPPHRAFQNLLWSTAAQLGHTQFVDRVSSSITDDHVPFQERGIPSVDVIHIDQEGRTLFPDSWHTTFDTPEHMSRESLHAVGETLLAALAKLEADA